MHSSTAVLFLNHFWCKWYQRIPILKTNKNLQMTRMVFHPLILSSGIQKFHTKALQKYNKLVNTFVYENVVFVVILDSIAIKMSSNFFYKGLIHWAKFIHSSKLTLLLRRGVKNTKVLSMAYSICVSSTAFHFRHQEHTLHIKHP